MIEFAHIALTGLILMAVSSLGDVKGECSNRGHVMDGSCVCDNTRPAPGVVGGTGQECEIDVHRGVLDGRDLTSSCSTRNCNSLHKGDWVCFYSPIDWNSTTDPWNFLSIQMNHTSEDHWADPDLYGLFDEVGNKGQKPENSSYHYEFRETTSGSFVSRQVKKHDFSSKAYDGVYLCVKMYGNHNATFSLRGVLSECPSDFTKKGEQRICSTLKASSEKRHTGCNSDGSCICKDPFKKPIAIPYAGLGFDDCSARVTEIPDSDFDATHSVKLENQGTEHAPWNYYSFGISENNYHVVASVEAQTNGSDRCATFPSYYTYLKSGQPPGNSWGQYDLKSPYTRYGAANEIELSLEKGTKGYRTGHWFLGIHNSDKERFCNYTVTISTYECMFNCTNQGQCIHMANGTHFCDCDTEFFGRACTHRASLLEYNKPVVTKDSAIDYDYYDLPAISPSMLGSPVEVRFSCSFHSRSYSSWTSNRPELLLLKGDDDSYPTTQNATFRVAMEEQNTTYHVDLCPSQLKNGLWRAAIFSPYRSYKLTYNLTVTKRGSCLNRCSGHGICSDEGVCKCDNNWGGGDCSVNLSGQQCLEGSRQPVQMVEQSGTCWKECKCSSGNCRFENSCSDFVCSSPDYRRKGTENQCIKDHCTQDFWEETDSHSCLKKCGCPSNGDACSLASQCDPLHFSCKHGYKRFSDRSQRCYKLGCEPASLSEAGKAKVQHGTAYGTCVCGHAEDESENESFCKVSETDAQNMPIVCHPGFSLKGAKEQDSGMMIGGKCVRSNGISAGGAIALVLGALVSGVCMSVAYLWYYDISFRRQSTLSSHYQELSSEPGNGF